MCPDIEAFAPLIQRPSPPARRSRTSWSGSRTRVRQTNPVLGAVARLLELAG